MMPGAFAIALLVFIFSIGEYQWLVTAVPFFIVIFGPITDLGVGILFCGDMYYGRDFVLSSIVVKTEKYFKRRIWFWFIQSIILLMILIFDVICMFATDYLLIYIISAIICVISSVVSFLIAAKIKTEDLPKVTPYRR